LQEDAPSPLVVSPGGATAVESQGADASPEVAPQLSPLAPRIAKGETGPRLILASASPRRRSLLREAGFEFIVYPANLDEESFGRDLSPIELARQLAIAKANVVAEKFPEDFVLAADTVVAFGEQVLGKPANEDQAFHMLALLSGTTHIVITGVSLQQRNTGNLQSARVMSAVRMKFLTRKEIETYVAGGEWRGKAGGYGIQDADPYVMRLSGCHTNIVGLPMTTTVKMLKAVGIEPVGTG
jgi:septum formation protein